MLTMIEPALFALQLRSEKRAVACVLCRSPLLRVASQQDLFHISFRFLKYFMSVTESLNHSPFNLLSLKY